MTIKAIILDTETTGLRDPEPVEIGFLSLPALETFNGTLLHAIPSLQRSVKRYKPSKPIEIGAQKVHGISMSDVIRCQPYRASDLHSDIHPNAEYLICHNISFDWRVLTCEVSRFDPEIDFANLKQICTLKLARKIWPDFKSKALLKIIEEFCPDVIPQFAKHAHGSIMDCMLTAIVVHFAAEEFNVTTWEELYQLQF